MFKKLTALTERYARHPHAERWLFACAVAESLIFPIPPEVMLIVMGLARRGRAFRYSLIAAAGSVVGGLIGYALGRFAFDPLVVPVLEFLCAYRAGACPDIFVPQLRQFFDDEGVWLVGVAALSPAIPYRLAVIAAGMGEMNVAVFIGICFAFRLVRYALVTLLVAHYGRKALHLVRDQLPWVLGGIGVLALVVYAAWVYF